MPDFDWQRYVDGYMCWHSDQNRPVEELRVATRSAIGPQLLPSKYEIATLYRTRGLFRLHRFFSILPQKSILVSFFGVLDQCTWVI